MSKFSDLLLSARRKERPPVLIASLPRNDPELACAALAGGADVLKVHINLQHRASQTRIGSLAEERTALKEILSMAGGCPVGIVPGTLATIQPDELEQLAGMGFAFLSLYLHDAPAGLLPPTAQLERMLALSYADPLELAGSLDALEMQVCELSIMAPDTYGQPLTALDLARYAAVRQRTALPLVVPSQHAIPPRAVPELAALGIEGIMLGTIVCGLTPASWQSAFQQFRAVG
jgi:hypothetical protein